MTGGGNKKSAVVVQGGALGAATAARLVVGWRIGTAAAVAHIVRGRGGHDGDRDDEGGWEGQPRVGSRGEFWHGGGKGAEAPERA